MAEPPGTYRWRDPPVLAVALLMAVSGFAQFSPAAALADVAEHFGTLRADGDSVAEQAGLPGSVLGAGLAVIRLSALLALPLAALADQVGRRSTILAWTTAGLLLTAAAAASPGYWWFVVALALARPFLTATNTVGQVVAAEHTASGDRAKAIALVAAAYGVGAGAVAVVRDLIPADAGFRPVFALAGLLVIAVAALARQVVEPRRYLERRGERAGPALAVAALRPHLRRLLVVAGLGFAAGAITGPGGTFLFVYVENVLDASTSTSTVLVVAAGITGLAGLLVGREAADRVGRRPTGALALVLLAAASVLTYSGTVGAALVGYPLAIFFGAAFGTPAITLGTELFPTPVRAAVGGWVVVAGVLGATSGLLVAGALADATGSFGAAIAVVAVPAGLAASLFFLVPETRGTELDSLSPEGS